MQTAGGNQTVHDKFASVAFCVIDRKEDCLKMSSVISSFITDLKPEQIL